MNRAHDQIEDSEERSLTTFVLELLFPQTRKRIVKHYETITRVVRRNVFRPLSVAIHQSYRQPPVLSSFAEAAEALGTTAAISTSLLNPSYQRSRHALAALSREQMLDERAERLAEEDENEFSFTLPRSRRQAIRRQSPAEAFLDDFLNIEPVLEPIWARPRFIPAQVREPARLTYDYNYKRQQLLSLAAMLDGYSMMAAFFIDTPKRDDSLNLHHLTNLALALTLTSFAVAHEGTLQLRPTPALRPRQEPIFAGPRFTPRPPNPQQFFAPNYYYRPSAAPRPMPSLETNEQRLAKVNFPSDLVPEEFKCIIMATTMDNPVRLPNTADDVVCDGATFLEAYRRKPENPYTRQPMDESGPNGPIPDRELGKKISSYVDQVVQGVNDRKAALGGQGLSFADYQLVNQNVLSRLSSVAPQNEPAVEAAPQARSSSPRNGG